MVDKVRVNNAETYNVIATSDEYGLALVHRERDDKFFLNKYNPETKDTRQLYISHFVNEKDTEHLLAGMLWFRETLEEIMDMATGRSKKKALKKALKARKKGASKKAKKAKSKEETSLPPEPQDSPQERKLAKKEAKVAWPNLKRAFKQANKLGKATVVAWYLDNGKRVRCHVSALDEDRKRVYVAKHHKARPGGKTGRWVKAKLVRVW